MLYLNVESLERRRRRRRTLAVPAAMCSTPKTQANGSREQIRTQLLCAPEPELGYENDVAIRNSLLATRSSRMDSAPMNLFIKFPGDGARQQHSAVWLLTTECLRHRWQIVFGFAFVCEKHFANSLAN